MCKTCSKCKVNYDDVDANFFKGKGYKYGIKSTCKTCDKKSYDNWAKKNPNNIKNLRKKYYYKDVKKSLDKNKRYRTNNTEKIKLSDLKRSKKWVYELGDKYIINRLKTSKKLYIENPTPEMIELYRSMMLLKREKLNFTKQVKQELNIKSL